MTDIRVDLIDADLLRVLPGEKLVVRIPESTSSEILAGLQEAFNHFGVPALIIAMDDLEFAVFEGDES